VTADTYLSLFSGIGGLDLGLDRAGWTCVGQVEKDPFCRAVLTKHWPEVPKHDDVRTAVEWWQRRPRPAVRLVAGGFPCQPFSRAGRGLGTADDRWGWPWFWDIVRALGPDYVLLENVAALVTDRRFRDAFGWILADLAAGGYDTDWDCIPAAAVGAPHRRDRVFLVANARRPGLEGPRELHHPPTFAGPVAADGGWWAAEPGVDRVAYGAPHWVDRIRGLGNAVVPQVGEYVGRLILAADRGRVSA